MSLNGAQNCSNVITSFSIVLSAGNPGTGNSREFPDFWHSRFPGIQGRDPGKKNPMNSAFFRQILGEKEFAMGTYFCYFFFSFPILPIGAPLEIVRVEVKRHLRGN